MSRNIEIFAIDPHVHLGDFNEVAREDLDTGTKAALAGGYSVVLDMPDNVPPIIDRDSLSRKLELADLKVNTFYRPYIAGTNSNSSYVSELSQQVSGLALYMNAHDESLAVDQEKSLHEHFVRWCGKGPICIDARQESLELALMLSHRYHKRVHICHVATEHEICVIKAAKEAGILVTCEVTPHHLLLDEGDIYASHMTKNDQRALWNNLDVIDCVASDHTPALENTSLSSCNSSFPGLETALPLMLTAVAEQRLSLERLYELVSENPQKIFGIPDMGYTYATIDLTESYYVNSKDLQTKTHWSPFEGHKLTGKVRNVYIRGEKVYEDGEILHRRQRTSLVI